MQRNAYLVVYRNAMSDEPTITPSTSAKASASVDVHCNFCGRSSTTVKHVIAGPNVNICNDCVDICVEILEDQGVRIREKPRIPGD